jgi:hypothetical protein
MKVGRNWDNSNGPKLDPLKNDNDNQRGEE